MSTAWAVVVALLGGAGGTILLSILWLPPKIDALNKRLDDVEFNHERLRDKFENLRVKVAAQTGHANGGE